ncbi:MAG: hypothetical protein H7222_04485 [Methylotenera sp.]|nr:hypothetical protein [Oligoflexia bacterium]
MKKSTLSLLSLALIAGCILRLIWVGDMEYKVDEQYMFERLLAVGKTEAWPWLGVASTILIRNPGMSVWVFLGLGKITGATTPTELCRAVMLLNCAALGMIALFARYWVEPGKSPGNFGEEREPWYWAAALVALNPLAIHYHRKIWAQSVLPFFVMLFLMAWWKREKKWGAFFWGVVGACLGQIHMSGFFFALGFVLWAFFWDRKQVDWLRWFLGSCLGSLTLIPWIVELVQHPTGQSAVAGWGEAVQLKFWVFWITDPLALHLGKALGVLNGNSMWAQLADFFRYPLIGGVPTYLVAGIHVILAVLGALILVPGFISLIRLLVSDPRAAWKAFQGRSSPTAFTQNAAVWGYGLVITLATVHIFRFYLLITFPLQFVWLARMALPARTEGTAVAMSDGVALMRSELFKMKQAKGRSQLAALCLAQLLLSLFFLGYIHVNHGSIRGDYGDAYHLHHRRDGSHE